MAPPVNKPNIDIIEGSKDVVLTIIHNKVKKIRTKPLRVYSDEEVGIMKLAKEINEETGVTVIINNTDIDLNSNETIKDNLELLEEFKHILNKINPQVVLDLHGMTDDGALFLNSNENGLRICREFVEKTVKGRRPDVDIEFRRKASSKFCTAKGQVVTLLAKYMSYNGLVTDIEAVYPGGNFIGNISTPDRDVIALEIARRNRLNESGRKKVVSAICNFINSLRGQRVPDEVDCVFDNEVNNEEREPKIKERPSYIN